jgi:hypothetical protein
MDLPLPLDAGGNLPAPFYQKPTQPQLAAMANMTWGEIIHQILLRLKAMAVTINPGTQAQETPTLKHHLCHHDDTPPAICEPEEDI